MPSDRDRERAERAINKSVTTIVPGGTRIPERGRLLENIQSSYACSCLHGGWASIRVERRLKPASSMTRLGVLYGRLPSPSRRGRRGS